MASERELMTNKKEQTTGEQTTFEALTSILVFRFQVFSFEKGNQTFTQGVLPKWNTFWFIHKQTTI